MSCWDAFRLLRLVARIFARFLRPILINQIQLEKSGFLSILKMQVIFSINEPEISRF